MIKDELIIKIHESSNEPGFFYDIYDSEENMENNEPIDGGMCTSTMKNAVEMATDQVMVLLNE